MEKKKDILFLCQYFYPEYVSSATLPFDTALALSKAGFTVETLSGYPKEYNLMNKVPLKETHYDIVIRRLKYIQLMRSNFLGRLINYFSFTIAVALRFIKLKEYKSIIVYSNPPVLPLIAALASKFYNTKVIFVSYDVYPEIALVTKTISENSIISKVMKIVNKIIFNNVIKVVALSNEMKEYLLKNRSGLSEHQIKVIPNWYDDKELSSSAKSLKNSMFHSIDNDKDFIVSYFGNMGTCQDLDTIVEAVRDLKNENNVQFVFAGHGNKMGTLKSVVEKENLKNVSIFDFLHGQDYEHALNISDCFIVSLAEGLTGLAVPSKTYSYMMASKPVMAVIGKDSDIAKDLIDNNAGYAMEVGESSKLVSAIIELRDDKGKRELMGKNCRDIFVKKYTKEHCTQQYVNMMQKILED